MTMMPLMMMMTMMFIDNKLLCRIAVLRTAYCYRRSSVVCLSVGLSRLWLCKNGWTDRDTDWDIRA